MKKISVLSIILVIACAVLVNGAPSPGYYSSEEFGGSSEERYYPIRGGNGENQDEQLEQMLKKTCS